MLTKRIAILLAGLMVASCAKDAEQVKADSTVEQSETTATNPQPTGGTLRTESGGDGEATAAQSQEQPSLRDSVASSDEDAPPPAPEPEMDEAEAAAPVAAAEKKVEEAPRAKPRPTRRAPGRVRKRTKRKRADRSSSSARALGGAMKGAPAKSTARRVEVQDRPSNTEGYEDHGVNEMTDTAEDHLSTFSIDVDTGSYTIARRKLNEGKLPPKASVRVEEFVNYFHYDYPSPDRGAFGVHLEAAPSPFSTEKDTYLMRVGVQGKKLVRQERKPVHLTFLVDVSGSMNRRDKLPLAQKALKVLTNNLQGGDTVAIASYAGRVAKILDPTDIHQKGRILEAIDGLRSGGGTGMSSGMELAYKLALTNYEREHVNRVIVLSDGDANIGPSSHGAIMKRIKHFVDEGVTLSTIGFGMGNYKDTMMEQLANKGNGNYYYIDSMDEARKVFGEQIDGTLQVIAKDVKIQVDFDEDAIPQYRLIGYENRDIADKDFRDDKVDAGEIGAGHTVTALYEVKLNRQATGKLATVRIRAKKPNGYKAEEQAFGFRMGDVRTKLSDASKDFQFASAVVMFAEILRKSPYAKNVSLDLVEEVAKSASSANEKDRQELLDLIKKAKRLTRG